MIFVIVRFSYLLLLPSSSSRNPELKYPLFSLIQFNSRIIQTFRNTQHTIERKGFGRHTGIQGTVIDYSSRNEASQQFTGHSFWTSLPALQSALTSWRCTVLSSSSPTMKTKPWWLIYLHMIYVTQRTGWNTNRHPGVLISHQLYKQVQKIESLESEV